MTGEILHGKTSPLRHDSRGVYQGLAQDLPVTRYHSLAGTHPTLPECLEVSSWIAAGPDGNKGVIMGVRHKEFLIEGVQFHPESILTAEGRTMLGNFLKMRGGTWAENARMANSTGSEPMHVNGTSSSSADASTLKPVTDTKTSILVKIFEHRKAAVAAQMQIPSLRQEDLQAAYDLNLAPAQIDFVQRLRQSPYSLSLMAEIKRASPSKGIISLSTCAPAQARTYALAGASVISVLTEPEWFKGGIDDLRAARQALEGMPNRPAVLRKEFVFNEYQILEARLAGADTILLIVKMLDESLLRSLYMYSLSLGMEPLVEVNNEEEMRTALALGSKVIGVNNRNLASFEVDLNTTSRLMSTVPQSTIVCALSGISGPKDVEPYLKNGVKAVLVGEALMRAKNTAEFVRDLLSSSEIASVPESGPDELLVKICGTRSPEAARAAIEAGADLIGIILVEGRRRFVPEDTALAISEIVHNTIKDRQAFSRSKRKSNSASNWFAHTSEHHVVARHRALLVGVFQNQSLSHILEQQKLLDLDIVQLHGNEPLEWAALLPVPIIRSFNPEDIGIGKAGYHSMPLIDAGAGGSGESVDASSLRNTLSRDSAMRLFFAGGLDASNLETKLRGLGQYASQVVGVDVSSGVEENGTQNFSKIRAFVHAAKKIPRRSN